MSVQTCNIYLCIFILLLSAPIACLSYAPLILAMCNFTEIYTEIACTMQTTNACACTSLQHNACDHNASCIMQVTCIHALFRCVSASVNLHVHAGKNVKIHSKEKKDKVTFCTHNRQSFFVFPKPPKMRYFSEKSSSSHPPIYNTY